MKSAFSFQSIVSDFFRPSSSYGTATAGKESGAKVGVIFCIITNVIDPVTYTLTLTKHFITKRVYITAQAVPPPLFTSKRNIGAPSTVLFEYYINCRPPYPVSNVSGLIVSDFFCPSSSYGTIFIWKTVVIFCRKLIVISYYLEKVLETTQILVIHTCTSTLKNTIYNFYISVEYR